MIDCRRASKVTDKRPCNWICVSRIWPNCKLKWPEMEYLQLATVLDCWLRSLDSLAILPKNCKLNSRINQMMSRMQQTKIFCGDKLEGKTFFFDFFPKSRIFSMLTFQSNAVGVQQSTKRRELNLKNRIRREHEKSESGKKSIKNLWRFQIDKFNLLLICQENSLEIFGVFLMI